MASEWRESLWGDEISLEYGKALRDYNTVSDKFQVFGSNGSIGWTSQPLAQGPGVILGRKGAYRGVQYSREPFFVIDTAYYVVPKTELEMRWLYYAIKHYKLGEIDDGSPIPSTTRAAVYVRDLQVPLLSEQKAIAQILGSLDDKIELNRRMNVTLEAMAQALFKSWFVDFDFPNFDGNLIDGLSKGWKKINLEELIDTVSITHKFPEDKIIFLNTSDISDGRVLHEKYSGVSTLPGQAKKSIKKNDILYSEIRPANKRYAFIDFEADDYVVSTKLMVLRAKDLVDPIVIYYFLKRDETVKWLQILAESRSGTFPQITFQQVKTLEMIVPDAESLKIYTATLKAYFEKVNSNHRENQKLSEIRDTLLPKLISGQLRIPEAEAMAEAAV